MLQKAAAPFLAENTLLHNLILYSHENRVFKKTKETAVTAKQKSHLILFPGTGIVPEQFAGLLQIREASIGRGSTVPTYSTKSKIFWGSAGGG